MEYSYFCRVCDSEKIVEHSMKETPEIFCDKCKNLMVRQIYRTNFSLKGGGWAADLYSKNK